MSIDIPEDTLKQWHEEFEVEIKNEYQGIRLVRDSDKYLSSDIQTRWEYFKAAKTSSYELKETLRKRGNDLAKENVKLQERIKELEAEIVVVKSQKMREFMSGADAELAKRDQLIEQVYPWIKDPSAIPFVRVRLQWLKQVEELKGEK